LNFEERKNLATIKDLILETLKVELTDTQIDLIEECVRQDIFHSTLDWQTKTQLKAGIRKAYKLLKICEEL
jgi:hypothetical protein